MKGIYKHIDYYGEIQINRTFLFFSHYLKTVKIKRLNIKEYLEFVINYRAWTLKKDIQAGKEIIKNAIIGNDKIKKSEYQQVFDKILKMSKKESKKKDNIEPNPEWLTEIVAFLGVNTGWTKEDVFRLYFDEVDEIIKTIIENSKKIKQFEIWSLQDSIYNANYCATVDVNRKEGTEPVWKKMQELRGKEKEMSDIDEEKYQQIIKINREMSNQNYRGTNGTK
jgi:hypothetical protein